MLEIVNQSNPYGSKLITRFGFAAGGLIQSFGDRQKQGQPTYHTIQVDRSTHVAALGRLRYLNHSCRPNTYVDTIRRACFAARDIEPNEELTYFYPSTEWDLAQPFVCLCGAPECIRLVVGAKYLPLDVLGRYFVNRHIRELALECLEVAALVG